MKLILPFIFAMAVTPALAGAQTVAPDTAMPPRPNMAAMQQLHAQMKQIHDQSRAQILASLSPAHRALLANIVGQLAISPAPNRDAAVRALDAALTPIEARNIVGVETAARTQSRALMTSARAQFEASMTPEQRDAMAARMASRHTGARTFTARPIDPGKTLLELSLGHEGRMGMGFGGPHPPGGPSAQ